MNGQTLAPKHIDIKRDRGARIEWADGSMTFLSVKYLRRWSPSAEAKQMREQLAKNPLTVLPASAVNASGQPLRIENAEFVGHYAIKFIFSDGHSTGLYTWEYLQEIDPRRIAARRDHERERGGGGDEGDPRATATDGPAGGFADGVDPEGESWRREFFAAAPADGEGS